nr:hypothetical protein BaRGS_012356 [Batillaria attramentaria]
MEAILTVDFHTAMVRHHDKQLYTHNDQCAIVHTTDWQNKDHDAFDPNMQCVSVDRTNGYKLRKRSCTTEEQAVCEYKAVVISCPSSLVSQQASVSSRVIYDVDDLLLDRKNLSRTRRAKNSAEDDRISVKVMGATAVLVLTVFAFIIVGFDVPALFRAIRDHKQKMKGMT